MLPLHLIPSLQVEERRPDGACGTGHPAPVHHAGLQVSGNGMHAGDAGEGGGFVMAAEGASGDVGEGVSFGMMTNFWVGEYFWRQEEEFGRPKIRKRANS